MSDWMDSPEMREFTEMVFEKLCPMIQESALTVSIAPRGPADIKFAVELGLSIMYDKPIIVGVQPGQQVPGKLIAAADEIVELSLDPLTDRDAIGEAIRRVMLRRYGGE